MLEAVSEPPLMQRQFPSIHFSLVSSNEERNIRRGSRATPLRHPHAPTFLPFNELFEFAHVNILSRIEFEFSEI